MPHPKLRILVPALIAAPDDERRLAATLAGLPPGLDAVAHPIVQVSLPGFDPEASPLLRSWRPPGDLESRAFAPVRVVRDAPFSDLATPPADAPFADAPPPAADTPFPDAPAPVLSPDLPCLPVEPIFLGPPRGKWAALREGLARCGPAPWIAAVDGDDAYDLAVLTAILWRAEEGEGDLFQGARARIMLDRSDVARQRALLEPVLNELVRERLAARGTPLAAELGDLQSGLFVARRELLERFFDRERMDGAGPGAAPAALPWGAYGGELHLHAFAAAAGARVRAHPVRERFGRESGLTPAGIGAQLVASHLFAGLTAAEVDAAVSRAAARGGWDAANAAAARRAAGAAFPEAV